MEIDKTEITKRLFKLKTQESVDFFNFSESEKTKSSVLNNYSKNKSELNFIKSTLESMGLTSDASIDKQFVEFKKEQEFKEIQILKDKIIGLLDKQDE